MGKKTLYLMHEETRYDDDTWLLNVPDGYEVSYELTSNGLKGWFGSTTTSENLQKLQ